MDANVIAKFMCRVAKSPLNGCWFWTGRVAPNGYGYFHYQGRATQAHRVSYELFVGPIPEGKELDHTCHDPKACSAGDACPHRRCVNPDHVEAVLHRVNLERGGSAEAVRKRHASITHCPYGHPYDEKNTYRHRGQRICRACQRRRMQAIRDRKKAA